MSIKKNYPTYVEAQKIVQREGISIYQDYIKRFKGLGLPCKPAITYKDHWTDWLDFFGKSKVSYPSYEEAKKILQAEGIKSAKVYRRSCKRLGLPSNPINAYKGHWTDWYDFFGSVKVEYPSYEEAKKTVQTEGIKSASDYNKSCKGLGLPSNPINAYKDHWTDWYDFLGKPKKVSLTERKYRILAKLSINPILLQEDAPLQVIYILASQLNKKLAKEMEGLLGTTSFEERLRWVKEQLNKLKEGSSPLHKASFATPADELSAMKSILEEFEVTDKISFTLENYLHSAVNRELISESDD